MTRSTSADPPKVSKRKGTRSVSSLSPAQLERKRANDREAQRAIRHRTRSHIDELEREIVRLKSSHQHAHLQQLMQRNSELERELATLRESLNFHHMASTPYSAPGGVFDDTMSTASAPVPSPRTSPFPAGPADFSTLEYSPPQFPQVTSNPEQWSAPNSAVSNTASGVPSPTSSATADELYNIGTPDMTPLRISHPMLPSNSSRGTTSAASNTTSSSSSSSKPSVKAEFDDVDAGRSGMISRWQADRMTPRTDPGAGQVFQLGSQRMPTVITSSPAFMTQQPISVQQHLADHSQPWNIYNNYYSQMPQVQSPVH